MKPEMYNNLLRIGLKRYKYYRKSGFKLASGVTSPFYFDLKLAIGNSEILYSICIQIKNKLRDHSEIKSIGGIESGSSPIASAFVIYDAIANNSDLNFFYIRKEKSGHGTEKMIEGVINPPSVLVEDVMTKGNSVRYAIKTAKDNYKKINLVIPIIFRGTRENKTEMEKYVGAKIDPIFYEEDFLD